ncbi:MAG: heme o synthase, partial [Candidatus Paceibacterota bacterium]
MVKTYYLLTKPGIIMGNGIAAIAGFALASEGRFHPLLFLGLLVGLALVIASACVVNNYLDRDIDEKMARTKNRALVKGLISGKSALIFASTLGILGTLILFFFTNTLTAAVGLFGWFFYVVVYTLLKRRTVYGTLIGSISGAIPPVAGYCAVANRIDVGALILFVTLCLWQMPHFFAIAIYRLKDYKAADIPVLPIKSGIQNTKIHMVLYATAYTISAAYLTILGYTGFTYLVVVG